MICRFQRVVVFLTILSYSLYAKTAENTFTFDIQEQNLSAALVAFSKASKRDYIAPMRILSGRSSSTVQGSMSAEEALQRLLHNTGLRFKESKSGIFIIKAPKQKSAMHVDNPIEDLIVTAQKRQQLRQDIPFAVSSYDGDTLNEKGVTNSEELYKVSTSFFCHGGIASASQGICLRGAGSSAVGGGLEQSIGTIVDGIAAGPNASGLQELWDIERIEILHGPQGTLFGKNASAGIINQVTRDPGKSFAGGFSSRYEFDTNATRYEGGLSLPFSHSVFSRLSGFYLNDDNEESRSKESWGLRAKILAELPAGELKLSVSSDKSDRRCCGLAERNSIDSEGENNYRQDLLEDIATDQFSIHYSLPFHGDFEFKSIGGYRRWQYEARNAAQDHEHIGVRFSLQDIEILSQELQLLSPRHERLEYVIGAYFYSQESQAHEFQGADPLVDNSANQGQGSRRVKSDMDIENFAIFYHSTFHISEYWAAIGGLRLIHERASAQGHRQINRILGPHNEVEEEDTDYMAVASLQYLPDDDRRYYGSVSRGYKGTAIDNTIASDLFSWSANQGEPDSAVLSPETAITYEIGTKNYFFNRRIRFDASLFQSNFDSFQASVSEQGAFRFTNVEDVKTSGFEMEMQARLWQGANFIGSMSWVDVNYTPFKSEEGCRRSTGDIDNPPQNETLPPLQNGNVDSGTSYGCSGNFIENAQWRYYLQFDQDFYTPLGDFVFQARYSWQDDVTYDEALGEAAFIESTEAYGILDFRLGLEHLDSWRWSLFVNNVLDEESRQQLVSPPVWRGPLQGYKGEGRIIGLEMNYIFE